MSRPPRFFPQWELRADTGPGRSWCFPAHDRFLLGTPGAGGSPRALVYGLSDGACLGEVSGAQAPPRLAGDEPVRFVSMTLDAADPRRLRLLDDGGGGALVDLVTLEVIERWPGVFARRSFGSLWVSPRGDVVRYGARRRSHGVQWITAYTWEGLREASREAARDRGHDRFVERLRDVAVRSHFRVKTGCVRVLRLHPDGARLLVGTNGSMVEIWHLDAGRCERRFKRHRRRITDIAVMPGDRVVMSLSFQDLALWRLDGARQISRVDVPGFTACALLRAHHSQDVLLRPFGWDARPAVWNRRHKRLQLVELPEDERPLEWVGIAAGGWAWCVRLDRSFEPGSEAIVMGRVETCT